MNITHIVDYTKEECITCGVAFYLPTITWAHKKNHKEAFYCPNGHSMVYKKSRADELQEQLTIKEREVSTLTQKLRDAETKPKRGRPRK